VLAKWTLVCANKQSVGLGKRRSSTCSRQLHYLMLTSCFACSRPFYMLLFLPSLISGILVYQTCLFRGVGWGGGVQMTPLCAIWVPLGGEFKYHF
jgi:hypothetical protein